MAPIASPLVTFKGRKKNSHVHQSPRHSLLCLLTPKRASTRSGIVSGAKVHTALIHPLGDTKFMELFSFSFFRHQPLGPSEFFWGSGKGACMKKKKRVPKGGGRAGGGGPIKMRTPPSKSPFSKKKKKIKKKRYIYIYSCALYSKIRHFESKSQAGRQLNRIAIIIELYHFNRRCACPYIFLLHTYVHTLLPCLHKKVRMCRGHMRFGGFWGIGRCGQRLVTGSTWQGFFALV